VAVSVSSSELVRVGESVWELPASARHDMRVPVRVFADEELLSAIVADRSLEQLQNVATLPGIVVRCPSNQGLAEEAPFAYKDVERVVAVVEQAGLARRVVQLRPLGVVKG